MPDDWVTYEDKELGFAFAHPQDWTRAPSDEDDRTVYSARSPSFNGALVQRVLLDINTPPTGLDAAVAIQGFREETTPESDIVRNEIIETDGRYILRFDFYIAGPPNVLMTTSLIDDNDLWTISCDPLPTVNIEPTDDHLQTCETVLASFALTGG